MRSKGIRKDDGADRETSIAAIAAPISCSNMEDSLPASQSNNKNSNQQQQQRVNVYALAMKHGPNYKDQVISGRDRSASNGRASTPVSPGSSWGSAPSDQEATAAIMSDDPVPFASRVRLVPDEELDDDSGYSVKNRLRIQIVALICVLLILVAVAVGIVRGVSKDPVRDNTMTTLPPTPFPTMSTLCDLAEPVESGTKATFGNTFELDNTKIGPVCGKDNTASLESPNGAWYKVLGTGGILKLSTELDSFPAHMFLYKGDCTTPVAMNLACEGTYQVEADGHNITWLSTAGQLYLIFVHGEDVNQEADFVFHLYEEEGPMEFRVFQDSGYAITTNLYTGDRAMELTSNGSGYHVCGRRAQLVAIKSQEENNFVDGFASEIDDNAFFTLGGFQTAQIPGDVPGWEWIGDRGTFPFGDYTNTDNNYTNWYDGEPDQREGFGDEDCATMDSGNGRWHDRNCTDPNNPFRFIVEVELAESRSVMIGDCDTGLDTDPLISIEMGEDGQYVCTYLSNAISNLSPEDSLASLLNSAPLSDQLSAEQKGSILGCAA